MVGRPHRRGPGNTATLPPLARNNMGAANQGGDPTIYVPDNEHYHDVPRGSLPPIGNLPDSWGPVSLMNFNNYRTTVVTLTTRLSFAFSWLVGDAEWAIGIICGAHGGE